MFKKLLFFALTLIFVASCSKEKKKKEMSHIEPPKAEKKQELLEKHNDIRIDNYYWLNEKDNEDVIDYLERENDYYDKMTEHTKDFQKSLFEEMNKACDNKRSQVEN